MITSGLPTMRPEASFSLPQARLSAGMAIRRSPIAVITPYDAKTVRTSLRKNNNSSRHSQIVVKDAPIWVRSRLCKSDPEPRGS